MLTINLIPKKLKNKLEMQALRDSVNNFLLLSLFLIAILFSFLIISKIILQIHSDETRNSLDNISSDTQNYANTIFLINQKINFIQEIQESHYKFSKIISDISQADNDGVRLDSVIIDAENSTLSIRGFSKNRQSLLSYKDELNKITYLKEASLPISSLVEKSDIIFDFIIKIDLNEFAKNQ